MEYDTDQAGLSEQTLILIFSIAGVAVLVICFFIVYCYRKNKNYKTNK